MGGNPTYEILCGIPSLGLGATYTRYSHVSRLVRRVDIFRNLRKKLIIAQFVRRSQVGLKFNSRNLYLEGRLARTSGPPSHRALARI